MILGESSYYYLLYGDKSELLAYACAKPQSESQIKFGSGFVAENLSSDKLSKLDKLQLEVYLGHKDFSLIPAKLFDANNRDLYIDNLEEGLSLSREFNFGREKFQIVWFLPARLNEILGDKYVPHNSFHLAELMLKKAEQLSQDNSDFSILTYLGQSLFICTVKNRQLQAVNAYEVRTKEDLLYYTSLNYQSYGLSPQKDPLYISGVFNSTVGEVQLLNQYFSPRLVMLQYPADLSSDKPVPGESNSIFALLRK